MQLFICIYSVLTHSLNVTNKDKKEVFREKNFFVFLKEDFPFEMFLNMAILLHKNHIQQITFWLLF